MSVEEITKFIILPPLKHYSLVYNSASRGNSSVYNSAVRGNSLVHNSVSRGNSLVHNSAGRGNSLVHNSAGAVILFVILAVNIAL